MTLVIKQLFEIQKEYKNVNLIISSTTGLE